MDYAYIRKKLFMPAPLTIAVILLVLIFALVWCLRHRNSSAAHAPGSPPSASNEEKPVTVRVFINNTGIIFDNGLLISLTQARCEGTQCKVSGTVRSPNYPELKIQDQGVGFNTDYSGKGNYNIQIISADEFKAEFFVSRKSN